MKKPPTDLSKTMTAIRRKLTRYTSLCETHCGYDDAVQKAVDARLDLEDFIKSELKIREDKEYWARPENQPTPFINQ